MKKLLSILMILALLTGMACAENTLFDRLTPAADSVEAQNPFSAGELLGFELLNRLYQSGENCVLSPSSLAIALGMAQEGAQGETLEQLLAVIGATDFDPSALASAGVVSANAVFTAEDMPLKQTFIDTLNAKYAAEWFAIDDQLVEKVNAWAQENTDGLIDPLLSQTPAADTGMLLINAIAMDADWVNPFAESGTVEEAFHTPSGDVNLQMMHQTDLFKYVEKDGVQIISLPYANSNLEMWIALPAEEGVEGMQMVELLETLAREGSLYLESDANETKVELSMPKLDIASSVTLKEALTSLGLTVPFSGEADFSGMSDTPLCMDEVMQKVRVQVDEAGTKAAASTVIVMPMMAAPGMQAEAKIMNVNRPFVLAVTDSVSGAVCFAGVVENPAS